MKMFFLLWNFNTYMALTIDVNLKQTQMMFKHTLNIVYERCMDEAESCRVIFQQNQSELWYYLSSDISSEPVGLHWLITSPSENKHIIGFATEPQMMFYFNPAKVKHYLNTRVC